MNNIYLNEAVAEHTFLADAATRLKRHWLLFGVVTLGLFLVAIIGIECLPKTYRGVASVTIEAQTPVAAQVGNVTPDTPFDEQTIGTEKEILQSRELLTDTVRQIGLLNKAEFNPNIHPSWKAQLGTDLRSLAAGWLPIEEPVVVDPRDKAINDTVQGLRSHLAITPLPRSRVIEIAVTTADNKLAAAIANKIADLYISNHQGYKRAASEEAKEFLSGSISSLKADADQKASALEQYRISHGLTTAMTATLVQEQVSTISSQLQAAKAQLADLESRANTANKNNPEQMGVVLANPTIAKYREQEGLLVAQQAKLAASYGADSPILVQTNRQLASLRAQIANEARRALTSLNSDVASARANVASLTQRLTDAQGQARTADEARARLTTLTSDADTARTVYNDFQSRLRAIDASMAYAATNVRVISHATAPTRPAFPNYLIMWPAAFILSLGVSGAAIFASSKTKGIISSTDIELLPRLADDGGQFPRSVAFDMMIPLRTTRTEALFDSAIEELLNKLLFLSGDEDDRPKSVMITSALPGEGKTTTALALAEAAKRRGIEVFLIDADMRSSRTVRAKTASPQIGLGDILRGTASVDDVARNGSHGVRMIPAGTPRGNPTSLLVPTKIRPIINALARNYDLIIVDAPPALVGGECQMLSRAVDTTVMLARWMKTPSETVALALKRLDPNKIVGGVLTMVDPAKMSKYGSTEAVLYSRQLYDYYQHPHE